jgi:hypothetical protein
MQQLDAPYFLHKALIRLTLVASEISFSSGTSSITLKPFSFNFGIAALTTRLAKRYSLK